MFVKYQKNIQSAAKLDYQQQYTYIIEAAMVSTPEIFFENSSMSPSPSVNVKNPSARKSLHLFTEVLDIKNKTAFRRLCYDKTKRKEIRAVSMLWSIIPKMKGHTIINEWINKYLYTCIL